MINRKDVQHIVKLARLRLTPKEIEKLRKELSSILDYIEELKEVEEGKSSSSPFADARETDVSNIESLGQFFETKNIIRKDESVIAINKEKLLKLMPETKNSYLKVRSVF